MKTLSAVILGMAMARQSREKTETMLQKLTATFAISMAAALLIFSATARADGYAEDRARIADLMGRYLFAFDWLDADAYAATFTEDGRIITGYGVIEGREDIKDFIDGLKAEEKEARAADESGKIRPATRHVITSRVINVDGDKATARSYWINITSNTPTRTPAIHAFGHYEDELVKQDGRWLFSERKIFNEVLEGHLSGPENPVRTMDD